MREQQECVMYCNIWRAPRMLAADLGGATQPYAMYNGALGTMVERVKVAGPAIAKLVAGFCLGSCLEKATWFKASTELPKNPDLLEEYLGQLGFAVVGEIAGDANDALLVLLNERWAEWFSGGGTDLVEKFRELLL